MRGGVLSVQGVKWECVSSHHRRFFFQFSLEYLGPTRGRKEGLIFRSKSCPPISSEFVAVTKTRRVPRYKPLVVDCRVVALATRAPRCCELFSIDLK